MALELARKFALDTNVFIHTFRGGSRFEELRQLRIAHTPFEYLSAVVVQELRSGAQSRDSARRLQTHVLEVFERRGRIFAPTYSAFKHAGAALAQLAVIDRTPVRTMPRTFANDVLLAASCREHGVVLVTANARDFASIRTVLTFDYIALWQ